MSKKLLEYCQLAQSALEEENQTDAEQYVELALQEEGGIEHPYALEVTAMLMQNIGDLDAAKECLDRAVDTDKLGLADKINANDPSVDHNGIIRRMLALAEFYEGSEALELNKTALELNQEYNKENTGLNSEICAACAELYLTSLCMEADAEIQCDTFSNKAVEYNSQNADAWRVRSSYYMSKENEEESQQCLEKSVELLKEEQCREKLTNSQITRILQMCIEHSKYIEAIELGESLVEKDETQFHVWYYMAWAGFSSKDESLLDDTREYLSTAKKFLKQLKSADASEFNTPDNLALLSHINEMIMSTGGPLINPDTSTIKDEDVQAQIDAAENERKNDMEE